MKRCWHNYGEYIRKLWQLMVGWDLTRTIQYQACKKITAMIHADWDSWWCTPTESEGQNETPLVLPTGPGNPPLVRFLPGGSVQFGSRPGQKPNPLCLGRVVTQTGNRNAGFWPGWNRTMVRTIRFLQLWFQTSIWVLIVSWHGEYVDCADLCARSPPASRFAIRPIFVELLWNNATFQA